MVQLGSFLIPQRMCEGQRLLPGLLGILEAQETSQHHYLLPRLSFCTTQ